MSRRYSPSSTARSSRTVSSLWIEPVMPDACRADEVRVLTQRSQRQLRFFKGNKPAAAANGGADPVQEEDCALHHAASENNRFRSEQRDQVGKTQAQVVGLAFDSLVCQVISRLRQLADS